MFCGARLVLHQLQHKEDEFRAANPSGMDQDEVPDDIRKEWEDARANRIVQFKAETSKIVTSGC